MTLYTVKWTERTRHEVDFEADGPDEALEMFWLRYNSIDSAFVEDSLTESDGPQDIDVRWFTGVRTR